MDRSLPSNLVLTAFLLNAAIAVAKLVVAVLTGSGAVLAEFIHSIAATASQALLLVGLHRTARQARTDSDHLTLNELRFWALVVPILLYSLGAGVAINEGTTWLQAPRALADQHIGQGVLGVSFAIQIALAVVAARRMQANDFAADMALRALSLESRAGAIGLLAAMLGLAGAHAFAANEIDALAAISIGLIAGALAAQMALETRKLLILQSPDGTHRAHRRTSGEPAGAYAPQLRSGPPTVEPILEPEPALDAHGTARTQAHATHKSYPPQRPGKGKKKRRR
ncbi:MAG: cation transporter [Hyphomicrobiaceae bacterium]